MSRTNPFHKDTNYFLIFSLINVHKRISAGIETLDTFANTQWMFDNKHVLKIRKQMNSLEAEAYKVTAEGVNIDEYIENFILGGHKHLLKRDEKAMGNFSRELKALKIVRTHSYL